LVTHGHITVNGKRLNLPSYQVAPGDVIAVSEKMRHNPHVVESMEGQVFNLSYLTVDKNARSATLMYVPPRDEIPVPIQEQLIVEFYNRLT
jgi:small subunit ribosomal protein S4